jgi:hypothetical protein
MEPSPKGLAETTAEKNAEATKIISPDGGE